MTDGQHLAPPAETGDKPVGPQLRAGIGEQPAFGRDRIAMAEADLDALWKHWITRVVALALAVLVLWALWRWLDLAGEQRDPCENAGFPEGCQQPASAWRQGQFVVALVGLAPGVATAAMLCIGAVVGRRSSRIMRMARLFLVLGGVWIAMHWIGRAVW